MLAVFADGDGVLPDSELRDEATQQVLAKGYQVTNDQDVQNVISQLQAEQDHGGEFDQQSIAQLEAFGVDGILIAEVTDYNTFKDQYGNVSISNVVLSVRLVDTKTASTQWIQNVNSNDNQLGLIPSLVLLPVSLLMSSPSDASLTQTLLDSAMKAFPLSAAQNAP